MNKVILMGRLTRDPEVRYSQGERSMAIAKYMLAIDRRKTQQNSDPGADFINCVVFGKSAEFTEKYFRKGMQVTINGRIQTGSYTNKDGVKVYTTDIVVEQQEFAEGKNSGSGNAGSGSAPANGNSNSAPTAPTQDAGDGFYMNIPDGIDEELLFS